MMNIRPATVADLPWLRHFFLALQADQESRFPLLYPRPGEHDADEFTRSMFRALDTPSAAIFVAEADGMLLGFVAGEILERQIGTPRAFGHAHYLYVMPAARKTGVARAMMAAGVAWLREHGVGVVECYGLAGDDGWLRRGFIPLLTRYYQTVEGIAALGEPKPEPPPPMKRKRGRPKKLANGKDHEATDAARQ